MDLSLPSGVAIEEEKDVLGGSSVLDSGIYKGVVELAYLDAAESGAKRITIHFKYNNQVIKHTSYISNRNGEFTYHKDGKNLPLPGYSQMDAFFKAVTGKGLAEQQSEIKMIKIYNFTQKKEVPTEVTVFSDTVNKPLAIGMLKVSEEKTTKESGYKDGTGEFREYNEFAKYFDAENGLTVAEKSEGKTSAEFFVKWKDKNTGTIKTKKAANPGAAVNTGTNSTTPAKEEPDPFK